MSPDLKNILSIAYNAKVLNNGSVASAFGLFNELSADPAFINEARSQMGVLKRVHAQRCFVSKAHYDFLSEAFAKMITADKLPPVAFATEQPNTKDEEMPSKLKNLRELAQSTVSDVEKQAEDAVTRLQIARTNAANAVGKIQVVAADIEQSARDLEDFSNQISNGGPE